MVMSNFFPLLPTSPSRYKVDHRQNVFIPHFRSGVDLFHHSLRIFEINMHMARISSE